MNCIDYMNKISFGISIAFCVLCSCTSRTGQKSSDETLQVDSLAQDTIAETVAEPVVKKITPEEIQITKELLYDKYTLEDTYPYKDTTRRNSLLCSKIYKYSRLNGLSSRITRTETVKLHW